MRAYQFNVNVPKWLALKALGRLRPAVYSRGPLASVKAVDIAEPPLPSARWVKIRSRFAGFCASDLNLIDLQDSPTASPFTSFPCVLGHEVSGEIIQVGPRVECLAVGDRVTVSPGLNCTVREIAPLCPACRQGRYANCENFAAGNLAPGMFIGICRDTGGGFGEYFVAHETQVFRLPEAVPLEVGALVEPLGVALQAIWDNRPEDGQQVLIIGGGVIGSLLVHAIRALEIDCRVTVVDPAPQAQKLCRRAGADNVIAGIDTYTRTAAITGAACYRPMMGKPILMGGFDRIFDVVGNSGTLNSAMRCLTAGGRISVVGIGHDVKLDLTPLWLKYQSLQGVFGHCRVPVNGTSRHVCEVALDLLASGRVDIAHMITHTFPFGAFEKMLAVNRNKKAHGAVKTMMVF